MALTAADINAAYEQVLGRPADTAGAQFYGGQSGLTASGLADILRGSSEYSSNLARAAAATSGGGGSSAVAAPNFTVTGESASTPVVGPRRPSGASSAMPVEIPQPANLAPLSQNMLMNAAPNDYGAMVTGAYGALGRSGFGTGATEIDQPGFDYWKSQLESGAITPDDFKTAFSAAATGTSPEEIVARTYGTYGRAGLGTDASQIDPGGFKYWTDQLQSGQLTPTDFAQKFSYDMVKGQQLGNTKGEDVHKYFYENQTNPFAVLDYAVKQGLQGEDLAKATGLSMNQIREYFGPVYNPIGAPVDKPGYGVGGQYGSVNGMPILNRGLVDNILRDNLAQGANTIVTGDQGNVDNNIGWDTASFNSSYSQGPAAFGVNKLPGAYGQGFRYEGDMEGLAKNLGINVDDFKTPVTRQLGFGQTTTEQVLDQNALYDALSAATKDYYRVTGAAGTGKPDAAIQRDDVTGNHASVLYRAYNDKLVPVGDPSYFNAAMVNKDPGLLAFVPAIISFMFPGVGTAIGTTLGMSGATATVVGNAIYGAASSTLVGGDPVKGAITGGVGGAAGYYAPKVASNILGAGDEAIGAARVEQLAQASGMTAKQVSEIISGSLAGGVNAALVGGQDPLEAFALTLAASFTGTKAKQLVGDFKKDLKKADFDKATLYAANAADSVTRSLISGGDVAQNLLADMGDTRQQIEDVFSQPKTPGVGTQIGPALAANNEFMAGYSPSEIDRMIREGIVSRDADGQLRIEISGTADDIKAVDQREREIRSLFGLGTPDPTSRVGSLLGEGGTGGVEDYAVFAMDVGKKSPQEIIQELEVYKLEADTPEKKAEIDKAISNVRYIDAAARSDQVDPAEIVRKEFQTELDNAKKIVDAADREIQKVVKEEPIKESLKDSEVKAESPDTKTETPAKTEATTADKDKAESSGATIISPGAGGTTKVADSTTAGGSTSGGGAEAGGGAPGVPKAQADALVSQLYDKAGFQDPEGAKWWSNQLTSGAMTPEFVAKAFAEELPDNEIVIKPGGDTTGTTTTTGGGATGLTVTGGEATGPYQTDGTTGTAGTGGAGAGAGTGSGATAGAGTGAGGAGTGQGDGTGAGQGTGAGDGTGQGTGSGSGQGAGTGTGTGTGEGTGGEGGGSGGSGAGAGAGTGTGTTGTSTGGTGGGGGGAGPKPELEQPEKPISFPQIALPSDPIGAPPTREWFDKFLTSSLTTGAFKSVFDPVTQTEQLVEPVSKEDEEMMLPSREAGTPEATIEELIALLTGGDQPSFYTYGSSDEEEDIGPPSGLPLKKGGLAAFRNGGDVMAAPLMAATGGVPHKGSHYVQGAGGGQDDLIDAKLADGEYVFDADIVAALGDGSNAEGARKLDKMREAIRKHKRSAPNDKIPPKAKSPLAYLKEVS